MSIERLRDFIVGLSSAARAGASEKAMQAEAARLLAPLLADDDWLPEEFAMPSSDRYRQFLLYADPLGAFSVVSFVWAPGQHTPIHDHTVWGVVGMLRGRETSQSFLQTDDGIEAVPGPVDELRPGQIALVCPWDGDIHEVRNASETETSISIHVYGANIGVIERSVWDKATGERKPFVSSYSNNLVPNLWA